MPCYSPLKALRDPSGGPLIFPKPNTVYPYNFRSIEISCGQCIGCRLQRSNVWAVRCMHESMMHADNCFITLTYDDDHLPVGRTLVKSDLQKFLKRLRDRVGYGRLKFYACGEYGDLTERPHYHACIFGYDFPDKEFYKLGGDGHKLWTSATLDALWRCGDARIGSLTFDSAAYVARYCMKKISGDVADAHYEVVLPDTGEVISRLPEFATMSNRSGGIGIEWFRKYSSDVFPVDEIVLNGVRHPVPRFYSTKFEISDPRSFERVKLAREGRVDLVNSSPDRLKVREELLSRKLGHYPRNTE